MSKPNGTEVSPAAIAAASVAGQEARENDVEQLSAMVDSLAQQVGNAAAKDAIEKAQRDGVAAVLRKKLNAALKRATAAEGRVEELTKELLALKAPAEDAIDKAVAETTGRTRRNVKDFDDGALAKAIEEKPAN